MSFATFGPGTAEGVASPTTPAGTGLYRNPPAKPPFSGVKTPPSGMVKVVAKTGAAITFIRNGDIDRTGSVGGWQQSVRVLREDADWYQSRPKGAFTLPVLLDWGAQPGVPLEQRIDTLYAMGYRDGEDPPELRLYGEAPGVAGNRWRWKLDEVEITTSLYRPDAPSLLRRVTIQLSMSTFSPLGKVAAASIKRTRGTANSPRTRVVVTTQGATLRGIAVRYLGGSSDYLLIQQWNPKLKTIDPDYPLRGGVQVVLRG